MPTLLEFMGQPGPHRDIEAFVAAVKRARPSYTEQQLVETVRRGNAVYKPRHDGSHWQVFGRDILTDDLHSIPAWPFLDSWWQQNLPMFPLTGGEVITGPDAGQRLKAAMDSLGIQRVNRRSLVIPDGLTRSYVWCKANQWVQEVADADVGILRTTPMLNQCFRSAANADTPVTPRTYEYGGTERHAFDNFDDFERYRRETAP